MNKHALKIYHDVHRKCIIAVVPAGSQKRYQSLSDESDYDNIILYFSNQRLHTADLAKEVCFMFLLHALSSVYFRLYGCI